jgi:hypothetical protein
MAAFLGSKRDKKSDKFPRERPGLRYHVKA